MSMDRAAKFAYHKKMKQENRKNQSMEPFGEISL